MKRVCLLSIGVGTLLALGCSGSPEPKATVEPEAVAEEERVSWSDENFDPSVVAQDEQPPEYLTRANTGLWKIGTVEKEGVMTGQLFGVIGSDVQLRMYLHHVIAVKPSQDGWERVFHVYKTVDQNFNPNAVVSRRVMIIDNGPLPTYDQAVEGVSTERPEDAADYEGWAWTYSAYSLDEDHMYWTCSVNLIGRPIAIDGDKMVTIRTTNVVETFGGKQAKVQLEVRNVFSCRLIAAFDLGRFGPGGYWYPKEADQEGGISLFESYHPVKGKEWHRRYTASGEYVIEEPDGRIVIAPDYSSARIDQDGELRLLKRVE